MTPQMARMVNAWLVGATIVDIVLPILSLVAPQWWFILLHGADDPDGYALLRRCGANWFAFAVVQVIALVKWRDQPHWLALVAGVRWSDQLTDWTYLAASPTMTTFGTIALLCPGIFNLTGGLLMYKAYHLAMGPTPARAPAS
jgi:hypothetical protein